MEECNMAGHQQERSSLVSLFLVARGGNFVLSTTMRTLWVLRRTNAILIQISYTARTIFVPLFFFFFVCFCFGFASEIDIVPLKKEKEKSKKKRQECKVRQVRVYDYRQ